MLADNNDNEWLIYERNSLYATEEDISFQNAAFETAAAENPFACVTFTLPEGGQGRGYTFTQEDLSKAMGLNISVKPNPATTWATVDYTLPVKMSKAAITVTNAFGITVISTELNGTQGQEVLDLRDLADGIYVYTISCGEYMQTRKLVITK